MQSQVRFNTKRGSSVKTDVFCEFGLSGGIPFARNEVRVLKKTKVFFDFTCAAATLSHKMKFGCQKLFFFANLDFPAASLPHEMRFECQKLRVFCDCTSSVATLLHEMRFGYQKLA